MYKQTKKLPAAGRMRVTRQESKAVQEHLLSRGYTWGGVGKKVNYTNKPFIFWECDDCITYGEKSSEEYFNTHRLPLHLFTDYFEPIK